jgi:hypothetical protein
MTMTRKWCDRTDIYIPPEEDIELCLHGDLGIGIVVVLASDAVSAIRGTDSH